MSANPDLVKRLAELVDGDTWQVAELLVEEFSVEEFGDASSNTKTGIRAALDEYEDALRKDHGIILKSSTMRSYRATALNWPAARRRAAASFTAHRALAGEKREAEMDRFLRKNKGRGLSPKDVARYRAEAAGRTKPTESWETVTERRIRSSVRSALIRDMKPADKDRWWEAAPVESRDAVVEILRTLIRDITP